jgi:hypothetical protein
MSKRPDREQEAAFVLECDDRFHRILVSDGVHYQGKPGWETVLTFFVIRRSSGSYSIVSIVKTFEGDTCQSRKAQTKEGIAVGSIDRAMEAVTGAFAQAIEAASGRKLAWHTLDLSTVTDMREQARRISAWGRVKAWMEMPPGFMKPSLS